MSVSLDKLNSLVENGIGSKEDHARTRRGNILNDFGRGVHDVFAIGISCFNEYDRGLVANLMKKYPGVQKCLDTTRDGDFKKLGTNLYVDLGVHPTTGHNQVIVFMFVQKSDYFRTHVKTSSKIHQDALKKCMNELVDTIGSERTIAMPQMGIFRNKNHWLNVKQTIEGVLDSSEDSKLTIYEVPRHA